MAADDRLAILDRPLYSLQEAARLLQTPPATLRRWLEGGAVKGVDYPPVIRERSTGSTDVTWAEFVEGGFLREYRRSRRVSLQRLRPFVDAMRADGFPYPLAHFKPYVQIGRGDLLIELDKLQQVSGLRGDLALVEWATGQLVAREPLRAFLDKVDFDPDNGRPAASIRSGAPARSSSNRPWPLACPRSEAFARRCWPRPSSPVSANRTSPRPTGSRRTR